MVSMSLRIKVGKWVKRHEAALILLGIALGIAAFPFSYSMSIYQDQQASQQASCNRNLLESQNNATYRANIYTQKGGTASIIKVGNCKYADQYEASATANMHVGACISVLVTRANGTVEAPTQPSC
jgi:hypothetical protein